MKISFLTSTHFKLSKHNNQSSTNAAGHLLKLTTTQQQQMEQTMTARMTINELVEHTSKMTDDNAVYQLLLEHYTSLYWEAKDTMRTVFTEFEFDIDGYLNIVEHPEQHAAYFELQKRMHSITKDLNDVETLMDYQRYTFTPAVPCSGGGLVRFRRLFYPDGTFKAFQQQRKDAVGGYQEEKLGMQTFWKDEPGVGGQYLAQCLNKLIEDCIED